MITLTLILTAFFLQQSAYNVDGKGVAIDGYDPVSYFQGNPQEGKPAYAYAYQGARFHFISEENLKLFREKPQHYAPRFGGWCAYAMGESGEKVAVNPKTYKIKDGNLFLFYNSWGTNTLNSWDRNEETLTRQAITNWKNLNADL